MNKKLIEWIFLFTAIITFGVILFFLFIAEENIAEENADEQKIEDTKETINQAYNTITITTENKTEQKESTTQIDSVFLEEAEQALFEIKQQNYLSDEENEELENEINRWISELQQYEVPDAQNLLEQFEALQEDTSEEITEHEEESESETTIEDEAEETENQENDQTQQYAEEEIIIIIEQIAEEYNIPSWFLKAIVRRESSFNNTEISYDDGIEGEENWNEARPDCSFTTDYYPHGLGLTKLTGWMYQGSLYPFCLDAPDNDNEDYYYAMRMQDYGNWIEMENVTPLTNPFDPEQNLERFLTGYAVQAYELFTSQNPEESEEEIWRRVAFHWNKGLYQEYDPENTDYLALYDVYVEEYQNE